jgi:hypothetical protein
LFFLVCFLLSFSIFYYGYSRKFTNKLLELDRIPIEFKKTLKRGFGGARAKPDEAEKTGLYGLLSRDFLPVFIDRRQYSGDFTSEELGEAIRDALEKE